MKITPPTTSYEMKEVTMGMKNKKIQVQTTCRQRVLDKVEISLENDRNFYQIVRGRRRAIKMEIRDYLSVM
jgi:hypothetical protein